MRAIAFSMAVLGAFLTFCGCQRPETTAEERGTIVTELPDLPNKPDVLPLPEGVDEDCPFAAQRAKLKEIEAAKSAADQSAPSSAPSAAPSAAE